MVIQAEDFGCRHNCANKACPNYMSPERYEATRRKEKRFTDWGAPLIYLRGHPLYCAGFIQAPEPTLYEEEEA